MLGSIIPENVLLSDWEDAGNVTGGCGIAVFGRSDCSPGEISHTRMLDSLEKSPGPRWSDWGGIKLLQFARLLRGGTEGEGGTQLGRVSSKGDIAHPVVMVNSLNASILSQNVLNSSKLSPDMMKRVLEADQWLGE